MELFINQQFIGEKFMIKINKAFFILTLLFLSFNIFSEIEIKKAIIPSAGLGTRLLPCTKSVPKELMPLLDRPAIQYILEEGLESNIKEFGIILNDEKLAIRNYFSSNLELESNLQKANKLKLIDSVKHIIDSAKFEYITQNNPLGLGHAILMGQNFIGNNYFGIFLPDDIIIDQEPCMNQIINLAKKYNASVIAVQEVPKENVSSYGIIAIKNTLEENVFEVSRLVEKPAPKDAPSNLSIVGRYVLSPKIFDSIKYIAPKAKGEIQLTDAISHMMENGERVIAYKITGQRLDVGTLAGWLESNIKMGLRNKTYKDIILKTIKEN